MYFRATPVAQRERNLSIFEDREAGETFKAIGAKHGISGTRAKQIWFSEKECRQYATDNPHCLRTLGLCVRVLNCLANEGIATPSDMHRWIANGGDAKELRRIPNMGAKSVFEVIEAFSMDIPRDLEKSYRRWLADPNRRSIKKAQPPVERDYLDLNWPPERIQKLATKPGRRIVWSNDRSDMEMVTAADGDEYAELVIYGPLTLADMHFIRRHGFKEEPI